MPAVADPAALARSSLIAASFVASIEHPDLGLWALLVARPGPLWLLDIAEGGLRPWVAQQRRDRDRRGDRAGPTTAQVSMCPPTGPPGLAARHQEHSAVPP